jgi:hypothetical protein
MYYPKSHITPNLYSNGELLIKSTNTPYIGYYFSTIDNKNYTGRYPEDGDNLELTKTSTVTSNGITGNETPDYRFNGIDNLTYSKLNKTSETNIPRVLPPTPFYPQPSEQDYQLGEFTRYFSKKVNENKYTETSGLFQNDLYIGFKLPWLITGDKNEVARVNENMVKLREQELGISGFGFYLKHNYIKFYR